MPHTANIFDSECRILVNPVNTRGISGAGLAKEFASKYPDAQKHFKSWCNREKRKGGDFTRFTSFSHPDKLIMFACTKESPLDPSRMEWIDRFINSVQWEFYAGSYYNSVAIPALGCGLGKLKWDKVMQIIVTRLESVFMTVELYPPK